MNNGQRDEIQGAGVEEQAAHDACDMHDSSLLVELYNLVVEADNQQNSHNLCSIENTHGHAHARTHTMSLLSHRNIHTYVLNTYIQ